MLVLAPVFTGLRRKLVLLPLSHCVLSNNDGYTCPNSIIVGVHVSNRTSTYMVAFSKASDCINVRDGAENDDNMDD